MARFFTAALCCFAAAVLPVLCADGPTERCPYARGLQTPYNGSDRPNMETFACLTNLTKTYIRDGAYTKVTLQQTTEGWSRGARASQVLSAIEEAINAGLDLFATHTGSASSPLDIHMTLMSALPQSVG